MDIRLVITSGSRSNAFKLKSKQTKFLHDFMVSGMVVSAGKKIENVTC